MRRSDAPLFRIALERETVVTSARRCCGGTALVVTIHRGNDGHLVCRDIAFCHEAMLQSTGGDQGAEPNGFTELCACLEHAGILKEIMRF